MGKNHFRVLSSNSEVRVAHLADPLVDSSMKELEGIDCHQDYKSIPCDQIDGAVIAAPTELHHEIGKHFLGQGVSLLLEKPVASTESQANELYELAREKKASLCVGHVERSNPAVKKLKEVLKSGFVGKALHFSFTRVGGYPQNVKEGNNVLLDLAVHDLDVLNFLHGEFSFKASVCHNSVIKDIPDTAEILLTSPHGCSATIHTNWITPTKIRKLRVTGTKGVCTVDYMLQSCELLGGNLLNQTPKADFTYQELQMHYRSPDKIEFGVAKEEPLKNQLKEWIKALKGQDHSLCSAVEAAYAVKLAEKAIQKRSSF